MADDNKMPAHKKLFVVAVLAINWAICEFVTGLFSSVAGGWEKAAAGIVAIGMAIAVMFFFFAYLDLALEKDKSK